MKDEEYVKTINSEDNLLLARFDGWELRHNDWLSKKCWFKKGVGHHRDKHYIFEYDDWNSLMPVVEKIESFGWFVNIHSKDECSWSAGYDNISEKDRTFSSPTKIESVYKCAINFIKWYNKEKENDNM